MLIILDVAAKTGQLTNLVPADAVFKSPSSFSNSCMHWIIACCSSPSMMAVKHWLLLHSSVPPVLAKETKMNKTKMRQKAATPLDPLDNPKNVTEH